MLLPSQGTGVVLSLAVTSSMPYAECLQLVQELAALRLAVQITFCGEDGSVSEIRFPLSEALLSSTGERYGI